jgi:hypothetical protein
MYLKDKWLLEATTLSRVWQMWTEPDRFFAILTAFRALNDDGSERSYEDNVTSNLALASKVRAAGYGHVWLEGYFVENRGTENEIKVVEDSLMVSGDKKKDPKKFEADVLGWLRAYNQEAALIKLPGDKIYLLKANGEKLPLGEHLSLEQVAENYSKLCSGRHKGRTFVFSSYRAGRNIGSLLSFQNQYPTVAAYLGEHGN